MRWCCDSENAPTPSNVGDSHRSKVPSASASLKPPTSTSKTSRCWATRRPRSKRVSCASKSICARRVLRRFLTRGGDARPRLGQQRGPAAQVRERLLSIVRCGDGAVALDGRGREVPVRLVEECRRLL